ncbi:MAG: acetyl-CoA hydrolase/transferase family protein [Chloroflexi bacterium AL-W]|nr:acetyl-CoA hydrolase/transferase family protein [Chloroflexi bacterium AL-N1]NOK68591.1 acetyl-CoA hydrolase/transferase family protein [Chloroflexi bacterium AL-N10]NOK76077.1 acetyl-CoA hydrolase/transferase family protein [Chloroflexi bacterium AL-N5]NOK82550.1 acetyl-CoA hydrolase/transferase family protein [Chloroflexi bacterium AL-W]NOK92860.1 acetyl-CoA hydrolase/transferase family protein [Chloroflexi bacterium AL-N15]
MIASSSSLPRVMTADDALALVHSNQRVYIGGGCGVPNPLLDALVQRADYLRDVEIIHMLTAGDDPTTAPEYHDSFRHNALFIGANTRQAVHDGRADFTPVFLSDIPRLFRSGVLPIDVALIQVSSPDRHGFCSLGVEVGCTLPAAQLARTVIVEMNAQMPRTLGDSFIHMSRINAFVETDRPLHEAPQGASNEVTDQIGHHIAGLIPDNATLQLGIGAIPDAVAKSLYHKRHLGIHTELFSDGVVNLVEAGVITGEAKTLHRGKLVAGFLLGTKRLFEWVHNNAMVELHPTDYVNDPFVIAQQKHMVAVNSALQVDLTGQVCADSIGPRIYSGAGGQVDFIRGASRSEGGLPIIGLPSTARNDTISRISPLLEHGAGVVTSRYDVHYVVTEYGVAELFGKTFSQRAKALIDIAHPKFRDELTATAKKLKYI